MTEPEDVTLTATEARVVAADTQKAFDEAITAADAAPPPPPAAPDAPGATAPAPELESLTPEDVKDLLEMTEDLWPTPAESPLWHAPDERERQKLSKPISRVANKWLPFLNTHYKEELGLALVLVVIYGTRRKAYLATLRAERDRKSDSGGRGEPANP